MVHELSVQQCDLITPFLLVIIFKWQVIPQGKTKPAIDVNRLRN